MNRKYIGLARREILLAKKSIRLNLIMYLAMMFIAVLIYMSMRFGNMQNWIMQDASLKDMIMPMLKMIFIATGAVMPITAFCQSYDENIISDFQCGWQRYSYTLPVSVDEQIRLKLGLKVVGFFPALILGLINMGVIAAASGEAMTKNDWLVFLAMICCGLLMAFFQLPMMIKTRSRDKAGMATTAVLFVPLMGIVWKVGGTSKAFLDKHGCSSVTDLPEELQPQFSKEMMNAFKSLTPYAWVLAVVAVAVVAVSILWARKMLKERVC